MSWTVSDLFPECCTPTCPQVGKSHMLPHQHELFDATENYIYWQAGVGSSKTVAHGVLAAVHAIMIPNNKIILFRHELELNYKTLWMRFKEAIKKACEKNIIPDNYSKMFSVKKAGDYTRCDLSNGSVAYCGQTKNWSDYMGPEYGFIGIDDAMENEHEFFRGEGTVGGMQSRLRLAAAAYFKLPNGQVIDMRRFVLTSNPPPYDHWLWDVFGKTAGVRELSGSGQKYRFIMSTTNQNDHLPPTYIAELASQHDVEDLKRILQGKSVSYYPGVKVFKKFKDEKHLSTFEVNKDLPLFVGIDPGYQHPAAIVMQMPHCSYDQEHLIALSEVSNLRDVNTWELMELDVSDQLGILPHLALFYPNHFNYVKYTQVKETLDKEMNLSSDSRVVLREFFDKILFCCDKSADKSVDSRKDKRSVRKVWRDEYGVVTRQKFLAVNKSLNRIDRLFGEICVCTQARLLIDYEKCPMLTEGFKGGYRFKKNQNGTHSDKPIEDHRFEDVADAFRYTIENFYLAYLESHEVEEIKPLKEDYLVLGKFEGSWEEMFR